jgi:tritrans,polycis-undecaprenyl-diphosphate synthase [geranylgeranyl-diphosphate specific]
MRVKAIGTIELLPESIKDILRRLDESTKNYTNHFLNIAIAYGGQNELVDAVKKIGIKIKSGEQNESQSNRNNRITTRVNQRYS